MNKIFKQLILLMILFTVTYVYSQEGADNLRGDTSTGDNKTTTATQNGTPQKISPFYKRKAERFNNSGIHYVNSDVYFSLSAKDFGTGIHHIEYAIDDSKFKIYTTPFRILSEGNKLIRVRAIDNSGNVEQTLLYKVYVDNTAPKIDIGVDREIYQKGIYYYCSKRHNFYIDAQDNESGSGIKMTYGGFAMDNLVAKGTGISKKENFFHMVQEGVNEYYYTAIDNVGNMSDIKKLNIIVDNTPPVVQVDKTGWILIPAQTMQDNMELKVAENSSVVIPIKDKPNTYFVNRKNKIAFMAQDPRIGVLDGSGVSTIYVKVNDEKFVRYKKPIEFKNASTYVISVKSDDNAGNISTPVTYTFVLDFSRPSSKIRTINSNGDEVRERK